MLHLSRSNASTRPSPRPSSPNFAPPHRLSLLYALCCFHAVACVGGEHRDPSPSFAGGTEDAPAGHDGGYDAAPLDLTDHDFNQADASTAPPPDEAQSGMVAHEEHGSRVPPAADSPSTPSTSGDGDSSPGQLASPWGSSESDLASELAAGSSPPPLGSMDLVACEQTFRALRRRVTQTSDGYEVTTGMWLESADGPLYIPIAEGGSVRFQTDASGAIASLTGIVRAPTPAVGGLQGELDRRAPRARIGCAYGDQLENQYVAHFPLYEDRSYVYFDLAGAGEIELGPFDWRVTPTPYLGALILDPSDPAYFGWGELVGLSLLVPVSKVGLGISMSGSIPYAPVADWFLDDPELAARTQWTAFTGELFMRGEVRAPQLPLALDGESTLSIDENGDGLRSVFDAPNGPLKLGFNGLLKLNFPLRPRVEKLLSIDLSIARSSAVLHLSSDVQGGFFSGELANPDDFLPSFVPLLPVPKRRLQVAGAIQSDNFEDAFVEAHGQFDLITGDLGVPGTLNLNDLSVMDATMRIDADGLYLHGKTQNRLHAFVRIGAGSEIQLYIPWDAPESFSLRIEGDLGVSGVPLGADAQLLLSRDGLFVEGVVQTPLTTIEVAGEVTDAGPNLHGRTAVHVPLSKLDRVVERVTDGSVCGYEVVRDAGRCGTEYVVDGARCGTRTVTDAGRCGTRIVADGAKCGWNWLSGLFGGRKPNRCRVAKSCEVARGCNIARSCRVAASCEQQREVSVSLGDFEGHVELQVGVQGLTGSLRGRYCLHANGCRTLIGGDVSFTPTPRACFQLPGAGLQCTSF